MKQSPKTMVAIAVAVAVALALLFVIVQTAGGNLDVVASQSATSFEKVLTAMPTGVQADSVHGGWSLIAPDGEARFIWGADASKSPAYNAMLEWDAQPFINAGLDVTKLPADYAALDGKLTLGAKLANSANTKADEATALQSYRTLVSANPSVLNFHMSLDHFGIKLGGGNLFEWARDMAINTANKTAQDKDIVFVLNPEPLIAAGVDPAKVEGWVYAQVGVMQNNTTVLVYKFLKPFNIV